MALPILDGNQSATTLSSILTSGEHIPAHTVVSLGTQAITDMRGAVSGSVVSISNFPATQTIAGTVTANVPYGAFSVAGIASDEGGSEPINGVQLGYYDADSDYLLVNKTNPLPISGTVTANVQDLTNCVESFDEGIPQSVVAVHLKDLSGAVLGTSGTPLPISGTVTVGNSVTISSLPSLVAGTANIGVVTIGNIRRSGDGALSQLSTEIGSGALQTVIGAGTSRIGSVTASISNSVVTFYPMQGTTVSSTNFTSTTASTTLVSEVANREVLTVFNEGAGNLHISPGATCTTISYQVRLSGGDYWECPQGQLSLAHTAVFATAGTARVCQVS